ncbi:hypothetical protein R7D67_19305, partial [Vibrio sp. Y159]|nr:hypothetical protein [Vibrio sp. Y159]
EPSAVKVARWVLRGTTLGNRCRLLDTSVLRSANCEGSGQNLVSYITKLERNGLAHVWRGNAPLKIKTASENNSN